jgi:hypothetical protein
VIRRRRAARWIGVCAVLATSFTFAVVRDQQPAGATGVWPQHWERSSASQAIPLTYRNQIGTTEAVYIHDALAKWGSVSASNWVPSGAARTDFSFAYMYGRPPSCGPTGPFRTITFCVVSVASLPGFAGFTNITFNGQNHIQTSWVRIRDDYRYHQGVYCHEWGHTLGLNHSVATSCHQDPVGANTPHQDDLNVSVFHNGHTH